MSNFRSKAFNPASKRVEDAEYCDNYYGRHRYGIRFDDGCVHPEAQCGVDAAAAAIDALQARVKELEEERDKWDRRTAYDELKAWEFENRATQQRQIDALTIRAEAAESRALRAEQERDEEEQRGDEATRRMTDLSNELHRVRQERDEAIKLIRPLTILAEDTARVSSKHGSEFAPEMSSLAARARSFVRRLAGP